jgi:hypothetical protein
VARAASASPACRRARVASAWASACAVAAASARALDCAAWKSATAPKIRAKYHRHPCAGGDHLHPPQARRLAREVRLRGLFAQRPAQGLCGWRVRQKRSRLIFLALADRPEVNVIGQR